jgi:hypothetical protein
MLTELLRRPEKSEKISPIWIEYWLYQFDRVASGNLDTWDYQWVFHILKNNLRCIVPTVNLVDNIGWGQQSATHTKIENSAFTIQTRPQERMTLVHPPVTKGHLPKTGATFENHLKKVWCLLPEFEKDRLQFRS